MKSRDTRQLWIKITLRTLIILSTSLLLLLFDHGKSQSSNKIPETSIWNTPTDYNYIYTDLFEFEQTNMVHFALSRYTPQDIYSQLHLCMDEQWTYSKKNLDLHSHLSPTTTVHVFDDDDGMMERAVSSVVEAFWHVKIELSLILLGGNSLGENNHMVVNDSWRAAFQLKAPFPYSYITLLLLHIASGWWWYAYRERMNPNIVFTQNLKNHIFFSLSWLCSSDYRNSQQEKFYIFLLHVVLYKSFIWSTFL